MANEFKIKKGLIVTGASGGTVVDIQGSQGQLFSVTDDLSGSIFAVSDISGVPILDVNSSGLSTFDGNVNLPDSKKILLGTGNDFQLYHDGTHGVLNNTTGNLYTSALGSMMFRTSLNVTALTLDASQNATFAGDVTVEGSHLKILNHTGAYEGAGTDYLYVGGSGLDGTDGAIYLGNSGDGTGYGWRFFYLGSGSGNGNKLIIRSENAGSGVDALSFTQDGYATFATQAYSSATSSGDGSSTLTTKGYVESLITGATIYRGAWDPSGGGYGSPDLSGVTQTSGYYYICSAAGTAEPNGTGTEPDTWAVGDWVIYNDVSGTGQWQKIDNSSVLSGVGTGQTVALWEGASSVTDSETLGNAPITVSGNDTTFTGAGAVIATGLFRGDTLNNQANTHNMIYRSGTTTFIAGGDKLVVEDGGHVGVGIADPISKFQVVDTAFPQVRINEENNAGESGIRLRSTDGTDDYHADIVANSTGGAAGYLAFRSNHSNERMRINSTGAIQFNAYGAGTLVSDASGNITVSSGGGAGGPYLPLAGGTMTGAINAAGGLYFVGDSNMGFVPYPIGAQFRSDSSALTGYIKIELPTDIGTNPDDMVSFYVDVYDYTTNEMISLFIGGYTYTSGGAAASYWYNCTAIINTKQTGKDFDVKFGFDGTHFYVAIGETTSVWSHPSIVVRDVQCSYRANVVHYIDGWDVSVTTTALVGVDETQTGNLPKASGAPYSGLSGAVPTWDQDTTGNAETATYSATQAAGDDSTLIATTAYADAAAAAVPIGNYLPLAGGTLTGNLTITKSSATMKVSEAGGGDIRMVAGGATGYMGTYNNTSMQIMQNGSNAIFIDTSKNVGIGTTNPDAKLVVEDDSSVVYDASAYQKTFRIEKKNTNGNDQFANIKFSVTGYEGQTTGEASIGVVQTSNASSGNLVFGTRHDGTRSEKMRITSVGKVGIGTTSPYTQLQVGDSEQTTSAVITIASRYGGSNPYLNFRSGHPSNSNVWNMASIHGDDDGNYNGKLEFRTANSGMADPTIKMIIKASGKVGIGTTSPDYKLDVDGDIRARDAIRVYGNTVTTLPYNSPSEVSVNLGTYNNQYAYIDLATSHADGSWIDFSKADGTDYGGRIRYANSSDQFQFSTNNSLKMVINSSGNVGIGTTSPVGKLQVSLPTYTNEDTNSQQAIFGVDSGYGVRIGYNETDNKGYINVLKPGVAWGSLILQEAGGNVGIGTTSPENKLHVQQAGLFTGIQTTAGIRIKSDGASAIGNYHGTIALSRGTGSVAISAVQEASDSDVMGMAFFTHPSTTGGDAAVEKMRIDQNGNVGIGTTSPLAKLDIQGTQGQLFSVTDDLSGSIFAVADISGVPIFDVNSSGVSYFDGNVGIGTDSPQQHQSTTERVLHISNSNAASLNLDATNGDCYVLSSTAGGNFSIYNDDTNNTAFIIDDASNVGIGTTNPETNLMIYDTVDEDPAEPGFATTGMFSLNTSGQATLSMGVGANNAFWMSNVNRAFTGPNYYNILLNPLGGKVGIGTSNPDATLTIQTGSSAGLAKISADGNGAVYSANGDLQFYTNLAAYSTSFYSANKASVNMRILDNGNVGIGTTSPSEKLTVDAQSADGVTTTIASFHSSEGASGDTAIQLAVRRSDSLGSDRKTFLNATGAGNFEIQRSGSTKMVIAGDGKVGIGTASPSHKLDVAGDIRLQYDNHIYFGATGSIPYWTTGVDNTTNNNFLIGGVSYYTGDRDILLMPVHNGNVGIRTTNPATTLDVLGTYRQINPAAGAAGGTVIARTLTYSTSPYGLVTRAYSNGLFTIQCERESNAGENFDMALQPTGGDLGVGTVSPSYKLDVTGTIRATGDVIAYSDARVKDNVVTIENALEKVTKLRGVSYTRNDVEDKTTKIGVIAQEVLEVLPEVVQQDDEGKCSVAYGNMVGLLIESIKELKAEVDELKSRL